jgi:hypothetical protein
VHGKVQKVGGRFQGELPDNYSINWVQIPQHAGKYRVRVANTSHGGRLRASVVCQKEGDLVVTRISKGVGPGGASKWFAVASGGCQRVIVVITNHAQTSSNPPESQDRTYKVRTSDA